MYLSNGAKSCIYVYQLYIVLRVVDVLRRERERYIYIRGQPEENHATRIVVKREETVEETAREKGKKKILIITPDDQPRAQPFISFESFMRIDHARSSENSRRAWGGNYSDVLYGVVYRYIQRTGSLQVIKGVARKITTDIHRGSSSGPSVFPVWAG